MKNLVITLTITFMLISTGCFSNDFNGHWKGRFTLQGSSWPMQLHIDQTGTKVKALLDIPNLVYAREPIKAVVKDSIIELTFPFGIGTQKLKRKGDRLYSLDKRSLTFIRTEAAPYRIEQITWKSGKEQLKGSYYIPDSKGKHPLLIRLHGAHKGNRKDWEYRSWADYFARKGIATVIFDRRGEGESSNNSNDLGIDRLADDVIELISKMKKKTEIDTDKIILSGASQAGYISFIVNERSNDIDYMLLSAASSISLVAQERQNLIFKMRKNNESPTSINAALAYQQLYFHYVMTGKNWKVLEKAALEAQNKSWGKYIDQPQKEADLSWWRDSYNSYQPEKSIPLIKVPTLILFGEKDVITPPSVMIPQFKYHMRNSENNSFTMVVCPNVGHSLEVAFGRDRWGTIIFPQRSPKMFDEIEKWLERFIF